MRRLVREISYTFHGNDFMIVYGIKESYSHFWCMTNK